MLIRKKPIVHLYIRGNCGNQFFQYAFARTIQEELDADLVINYHKVIHAAGTFDESDDLLRFFHTVPYHYKKNLGWGGILFKGLKLIHILFGLKPFKNRTYRCYLWCARVLPCFGIYYFDAAYYPFRVIRRKHIYINGYFESPKYFAGIESKICRELLPNHDLLETNRAFYHRICETNSVCITIKRMDVNNEAIADIYQYDISYFYTAIKVIQERITDPVFFIFSDDIEWCKENLNINHETHYEGENNPIWEKIRLMSACKHFIIHNSTFSWWVQHLSQNENKTVIAPSRWMIRDDQPIDIYEDGWLYISTKGELLSEHE